MDKIYCNKCKYLVTTDGFPGFKYLCDAPENASVIKKYSDWRKEYSNEMVYRGIAKPKKINKHNDCEWFIAGQGQDKTNFIEA